MFQLPAGQSRNDRRRPPAKKKPTGNKKLTAPQQKTKALTPAMRSVLNQQGFSIPKGAKIVFNTATKPKASTQRITKR